jgi:predicted transcriptional regulator
LFLPGIEFEFYRIISLKKKIKNGKKIKFVTFAAVPLLLEKVIKFKKINGGFQTVRSY